MSNIRVVIDPRIEGRVAIVVHELAHIYLQEEFEVDKYASDHVIEAMVNGIEATLVNYINTPSRTHLLESWNKAIGRKLSA